jgi:glycosyltransferase 2 family protein
MPQAVSAVEPARLDGRPAGRRWLAWALRLIGLALLGVLLARVDARLVVATLRQADPGLVALSIALIVPLIGVKTVRWQLILAAQGVRYAWWPALLAYFGSLFIGFLTPGRLGEFVKAVHVQQDCAAPLPLALASVLADRLFDLYALLVVGLAALLALPAAAAYAKAGLIGVLALSALPLVLFLNPQVFGWAQRRVVGWGRIGVLLFGPEGWITTVHVGLRSLTWPALLVATLLTVAAYVLFFIQAYLLALALGLPVGFGPVTYAVALGSLITLLPISISGLGTREATMIAYLGTVNVVAAAALGFSLLVFVTFYLGGGLMGLVAWLIKPLR